VFAQASVLNLYDPDRAQTVTKFGEIQTWSLFVESAQALAAEMKGTNGAGFRILTGIVTSPTLAAQIQSLLTLFPKAKWHQWEPAVSDGAREGSKLAFGSCVNTVYRPEKADVILSLDSDFLGSGPGHIRYAREFSRRRNVDESQEVNAAIGAAIASKVLDGTVVAERIVNPIAALTSWDSSTLRRRENSLA